MRGTLTVLGSLLLLFPKVSGDYDCVCNYNVEKSVYSTTSDQSSTVGYMYEFDCKQQLQSTQNLQGWLAVAFEHKIGYVEHDSQIEVQLCSGDPPPGDLVMTSQPPMSSKSTTESTSSNTLTSRVPLMSTSYSTVSTPATTTNLPFISTSNSQRSTTAQIETAATSVVPSSVFNIGDTYRCAQEVRQFAQKHGGILAQFNEACYVLIKQYRHWIQAELDCNAEGGHLVHIFNQAEQTYIYSLLRNYYNHSIWIGLSDRRSEAHFEWSSGQTFYFVNWANHTHFSDAFEDCVVMDMHLHDGRWDDRECTFEFYPYICQYFPFSGLGGDNMGVTTSTLPLNSNTTASQSDGNTQLCPEHIKRTSAIDGTVLGQYEKGCYELYLSNKVTWEHGENLCKSNGGHLVHISNQEQQAFVEGFMQRHNPNHAVWLGLHDTQMEGTFQWTAGNDVQFTNWIPGHQDNTLGGHMSEDCVVFVPQRQGYWDDVQCGYGVFFGVGEVHYAFCQYNSVPEAMPGQNYVECVCIPDQSDVAYLHSTVLLNMAIGFMLPCNSLIFIGYVKRRA